MSKIKDPQTDEQIVKWVCRREDLYDGNYITKYPDILFDMKYGYGAGWGTECPLFGTSKTHSFVPGSHRGDTPVFFGHNLSWNSIDKKTDFTEISSVVLNELGLF